MHCTVSPRELYNCTSLEGFRSAALTCIGAVVTLVTPSESSPLAAGSDGSADGDTAADEVLTEVLDSLECDHGRLGEDGGGGDEVSPDVTQNIWERRKELTEFN